MLKFAGCILIFMSCAALGFMKASSYRDRRIELEDTLELIRMLDMEISYRRDPLAKTFGNVAAMKNCWFSHILRECAGAMKKQEPLEAAWRRAIDENISACPLDQGDIAILKDIPTGLGKSDVQGQRNVIEPAVMRIQSHLTEAVEQEKKQGRMYRGIGIASGVVIAVMLL